MLVAITLNKVDSYCISIFLKNLTYPKKIVIHENVYETLYVHLYVYSYLLPTFELNKIKLILGMLPNI